MTLDQREYWSIDIPGLTEEQAQALRERLAPEFPLGVIVTSPRTFMTRGFDRSTVDLMARCLRAGLAAGGMNPLDAVGARSMLEDCEEWLTQADG